MAKRPGESNMSFSVVRKKTPFQRHKEEEEAKRKKQKEEADAMYAEFAASFSADDNPAGKSFVRGEVIDPNDKPGIGGAGLGLGASPAKKGTKYVPSFIPPGMAAAAKPPEPKPAPAPAKPVDKGKLRNIDLMMEELKKDQQLREEREKAKREGKSLGHFDELPEDRVPDPKGSHDDGSGNSTNLYVGNVAPDANEEKLMLEFGRFGPIASVKIMWPRTPEEFARNRMSGFVAFMERSAAEDALEDLNGKIFMGHELRIGWGKAIVMPPQPIYPPPGGAGATVPMPVAVVAPPGAHVPPQAAALLIPPPGGIPPPGWVPPSPVGAAVPPPSSDRDHHHRDHHHRDRDRDRDYDRDYDRRDRDRDRDYRDRDRDRDRDYDRDYDRRDRDRDRDYDRDYDRRDRDRDYDRRDRDRDYRRGDRDRRSGPRSRTDPNDAAYQPAGVGPDVVVAAPRSERTASVIDTMASYVMKDGCSFEQAIMEYEGDNPEFEFLFDLSSPDHLYYRWRLYSLAWGDTLARWRTEPFVMVHGGPRWIPPPAIDRSKENSNSERGGGGGGDGGGGGASGRAQGGGGGRGELDRPLTDAQRDEFEEMLRKLRVEREDILGAMVFAIDNADAAKEVAETLVESLTLSETPVPTKVARLFLVSDILHNSSAPVRNASAYRRLLELRLPEVFESLRDCLVAAGGRITQEAFKKHVMAVLRVWSQWMIFPTSYLAGLQAAFTRPSTSPIPETLASPLATEVEALEDAELARRCKVGGMSTVGGREEMVRRLLVLDEYERGFPAPGGGTSGEVEVEGGAAAAIAAAIGLGGGGSDDDDDDDDDDMAADAAAGAAGGDGGGGGTAEGAGGGTPEGEAAAPKPPKASHAPVSKWTLAGEDDDEEEEEEDDGGGDPMGELGTSPSSAPAPLRDLNEDIFGGLSPHRPDEPPSTPAGAAKVEATAEEVGASGGAQKESKEEEAKRLRLRQVEVEVMVFREDLEEEGVRGDELEARVTKHRAELVDKAEERAAGGGGGGGGGGGSDRGGGGSGGRSGSGGGRDRDRDKGRSTGGGAGDRDRDRDRDRDGSSRGKSDRGDRDRDHKEHKSDRGDRDRDHKEHKSDRDHKEHKSDRDHKEHKSDRDHKEHKSDRGDRKREHKSDRGDRDKSDRGDRDKSDRGDRDKSDRGDRDRDHKGGSSRDRERDSKGGRDRDSSRRR